MTTDSGRVTTNPDPAVTPPSDSAPVYFIERGQPEGQTPTVWLADEERGSWYGGWTTNPRIARRFVTTSEADDYITQHSILTCHVTEHLFFTPPSDSIEALVQTIVAGVDRTERTYGDSGPSVPVQRGVDAEKASRALADRAREAERERDEAIKQRDYDYARFSEAKQAVIAADSERIAADAEAKALREALEKVRDGRTILDEESVGNWAAGILAAAESSDGAT